MCIEYLREQMGGRGGGEGLEKSDLFSQFLRSRLPTRSVLEGRYMVVQGKHVVKRTAWLIQKGALPVNDPAHSQVGLPWDMQKDCCRVKGERGCRGVANSN